MSREVRRVPLDFDWPLDQVWAGYLMPDRLHAAPCPACDRGYTPAREWLEALTQLLLMLPDETPENHNPGDMRRGRLHPYLEQLENRPHARPTSEIAELTGGLAGRAPRAPFGHDASDQWAATNAIITAAGCDPEKWGRCTTCHGHAVLESYPGQRVEAEAWEPTDPPEGEGWQVWETVSEGSPVSPVCATADELADWMSHPDRGGRWVPKPVAAKFIADGWAPSMVFTPETGVVSGVEWVGHHTHVSGTDGSANQ